MKVKKKLLKMVKEARNMAQVEGIMTILLDMHYMDKSCSKLTTIRHGQSFAEWISQEAQTMVKHDQEKFAFRVKLFENINPELHNTTMYEKWKNILNLAQ